MVAICARKAARWLSVQVSWEEKAVAYSPPTESVSTFSPTMSKVPSSTTLPPSTPMEPVSVVAWAIT